MYHIVLESAIEMLVPQCITLASSVVEIDACLLILMCVTAKPVMMFFVFVDC